MHKAAEQVKENHCQCPQSVQLASGRPPQGTLQTARTELGQLTLLCALKMVRSERLLFYCNVLVFYLTARCYFAEGSRGCWQRPNLFMAVY